MERFNCHYCVVTQANVKKYWRHLSRQHEHQPHFSVSCYLCRKPYKEVESLRRHIYRKYPSPVIEHTAYIGTQPNDDFTNSDDFNRDADKVDTSVNLQQVLVSFQMHITLFVLKVQEKHLKL